MNVTQREFETAVRRTLESVEDPTAGVHGPGSMYWHISREMALFVGGGTAALLQLAHPYVAHGVDQHSETKADPFGRFIRTFLHVHNMIFGEEGDAEQSAWRVRARHDLVHGPITEHVGRFMPGDRYRAHDHEALLWVHATLVHTAIQVYDALVAPVSYEERDRYYQESKDFAALFGIDRDRMPADWQAFETYFDEMVASDTIRVGRPAAEIAGFLMTAPIPPLQPLFDWTAIITAGFLPPTVRAQFGLRFGAREERIFRLSILAIRGAIPLLPDTLRYVPAYTQARARLEGRDSGADLGLRLQRALVRALSPEDSEGGGHGAAARARCPVG